MANSAAPMRRPAWLRLAETDDGWRSSRAGGRLTARATPAGIVVT